MVTRVERYDDTRLPAAVHDSLDLPQGDPVHEDLGTQLIVCLPDPVVTIVVDTEALPLQQPV